MKISNNPADPAAGQPPSGQASDPKASESKPFSKLLNKNRQGQSEKDAQGEGLEATSGQPRGLARHDKGGSRNDQGGDASGNMAGSSYFGPADLAAPAPAQGTASPAQIESPGLQGLVNEILVVTQPGGQQGVEVQFNSTTLNGLRVSIAHNNDQTTIKFSTTSSSVSQLLNRNLDQLSQALQAKGLHVAPIQVELNAPNRPPESGSTPRDSRGGGGQNKEQQQQQQQRQKK